jgi:tungstate transport system permease protein
VLQALGDPELRAIVALTLRVTGSALLIATAIGVPVGVVIGLARFPGRRLIALLLYTGMGLPPVVVGLFVYLLLSSGGPMGELGWLFTPAGMIVAQTVIAFPLVAALTMSAVESVDADLHLQIRALGATRRQLGWTVVREARIGVTAALVAAFGGIISEVGAVMLVGGNIEGQTRVLTTAIVLHARQGEFAVAMALGLVLIGMALTANAVLLRLQGRHR